ncbi:MAG: hypothetical protein QG659_439 [Patescibacteria group bacterium]|jgi:uncharacterized membrane protein YeaQ/YmgE (transglycosylase-associated protein family)|nr:hypothetical protein [Patescibacteria group bacterium]
MGILSWIILGALSGWIASLILKTNAEQGALGNIIMGIVGALIGGFLGSWLFGVDISGVNVTSVLLAVLGALVFAFALSLITGKKSV